MKIRGLSLGLFMVFISFGYSDAAVNCQMLKGGNYTVSYYCEIQNDIVFGAGDGYVSTNTGWYRHGFQFIGPEGESFSPILVSKSYNQQYAILTYDFSPYAQIYNVNTPGWRMDITQEIYVNGLFSSSNNLSLDLSSSDFSVWAWPIPPPAVNALFNAVHLDDLWDYVFALILGFIGLGMLFVAYRHINLVTQWNRMIDKRNADMGSAGWKYGKKRYF